MATQTYTKSGTKATNSIKLNPKIFGLKVESHELLKQAYVAQQANARNNNATTKLRGEVRGGGRKPHRQKGTGKARAGSIRSPLWRGGGITFGPSGNENYTKKINQRAKQVALRQALSLKAANDQVAVVETISSTGKTKQVVELVNKIAPQAKRVLLVDATYGVDLDRSTRNIASVKAIKADYLNVVDVLDADIVILTKAAVSAIDARMEDSK